MQTCVSFLTIGPMLQMGAQGPTRDKMLVDMILNSETDAMLLLAPELFESVARGQFAFGLGDMDRLMEDLESRLLDHTYSRSEAMQLLVIHFLRSTMQLWLAPAVVHGSMGRKVRALLFWLVDMLGARKCRSWRVRDRLITLLDAYLRADTTQSFWVAGEDHEDERDVPELDARHCIQFLADDDDVRVRFRSAVACARLFLSVSDSYENSTRLYQEIILDEHAQSERCVYRSPAERMLAEGRL